MKSRLQIFSCCISKRTALLSFSNLDPLSQMGMRAPRGPTVFVPTMRVCNFDDLEIRIPGCHGNSIILFEFSNGE